MAALAASSPSTPPQPSPARTPISVAAYAQRVADEAPPLTVEQRELIVATLGSPA